MGNLQQALNANQQAYGGLENQAGQQLQQNQGQVQQNLANAGLGNTTVAQTMQQAPLQTYNNAMLNLAGQQQGQAANIYGQAAQQQQQGGDFMAQLAQAMQMAQMSQSEQQQKQNTQPQAHMTGL
jgi:hypothetical protein